jgi:hypothetical protein
MLIYILLAILLLILILAVYVYYTTKDNITEAFQVIDNIDTTNMDINDMLQVINNFRVSDLSGVVNTSGNINAQELASKIQQSVGNDLSNVDTRPISDISRQCDQYNKELISNEALVREYTDTGDWVNVRATRGIIVALKEHMLKLEC